MINGVVVGRSLPLATGQTVQYNSELDDGYYETGLAKAYSILTTGQYSGTANVDLIHLTATDIAFVAATKKITQVAAGLAMFKTGQTIVITGSASNNGTYTIATGNVAAEIVVNEALTDEGAGAAVSIAKREAMSNNVVVDLNSGKTWLRYIPVVGGTQAGQGTFPWSVALYNAFAWIAALNAAAVGGFTDWRLPNKKELEALVNDATDTFNTAAFAGAYTYSRVWSSTTCQGATTSAWVILSGGGGGTSAWAKSSEAHIQAVRG